MTFNGIMVTSSARSEEYFNGLKNLTLGGTKNIRADKFLIRHIKSLAGTVKILYSHTSSSSETTEVQQRSTIETNSFNASNDNESSYKNIERHRPKTISKHISFLNEEEIWKSPKNNNLKRGKYLRICPDVNSIHNKPHLSTKIVLLQNGNNLGP